MASEPFETSRSDQNTTRLWTNARLATLGLVRPGLGIVEKGAVLARHGRIVFAGPADELPHAERDGVAPQAVGIAEPVDALMVAADPGDLLPVERLGEDARAEGGVGRTTASSAVERPHA